jgi:hypothetical protein
MLPNLQIRIAVNIACNPDKVFGIFSSIIQKTNSMKAKIIIILAIVWVVGSSASGQKVEAFTFSNFHKISIKGIMTVHLAQGKENTVKIEAEDRDMEKIKVEVSKGTLSVRQDLMKTLDGKEWQYDNDRRQKIKVWITFTDIREIQAQRGALVQMEETFKTTSLLIDTGSGAELKMVLDVEALKLDAVSGAILTLTGKASFQESKANTGGELKLFSLESQDVIVRANTGGKAEVYATKTLEANAGTGGVVVFKGNPRNRAINNSLGGEVHQD